MQLRLAFRTALLASVVALTAACGDDGGGGGGDDDTATADARPDGAPAGDGAVPDSGGPPVDASSTAPDASPATIACGSAACDPATEQCCLDQGSAACIASGDTCPGSSLTCDGPEDCPTAGDLCCARTGGGQALEAACAPTCNQGLALCHADSDCADGEHCCGQNGFDVCVNLPACP